MTTTEHPIDTRQLDKGSRVPASVIEQAFAIQRTSRQYSLVLLRARKFIELRLAERGIDVVTRSERDDIVILTDDEAAPFTDAEFANTCRKLGRVLGKQSSVDRAMITSDDARAEHDRALVVNGASYAGMKKARRQALAPTPRKRLTPSP